MADLVRIYRVGALLHLQIRSQPQRAAMALDHLGQRFCRDRMAHCLRLLSWYVANFGSYDKTYGSLGAIIGFMTWIWVSIIVVLVGAKLNAEIVWISEQEHLVTVALDPISSRYYTHSDNIAGCVATPQCHPVWQIMASIGFVVYSWLLRNWVFVVTNVLMLDTVPFGQWISEQ